MVHGTESFMTLKVKYVWNLIQYMKKMLISSPGSCCLVIPPCISRGDSLIG